MIGLRLHERAEQHPHRLVDRRRNAELVAHLREVVGAGNVLARVYDVARIVLPRLVAKQATDAEVIVVISVGIIGIIARGVALAVHERAGISHVEIRQLALNGKRCLPESVLGYFLHEPDGIEVLLVFIHEECAVGCRLLVKESRRHGPIIVQVDLQSGAAAVGL